MNELHIAYIQSGPNNESYLEVRNSYIIVMAQKSVKYIIGNKNGIFNTTKHVITFKYSLHK